MNSHMDKSPTKKRKWLLIFFALALIWFGGAYFLWHATLQNPQKDEDSTPFEFIPGSSETSHIEENNADSKVAD